MYPEILAQLSYTDTIKLWSGVYEKKALSRFGRVARSSSANGISQNPQLLNRLLRGVSTNISSNIILREVVILGLKLSTESLKILSNGLKKSETVEKLVLNECSISASEIGGLIPYVANSTVLRTLDLSYNELGPDAGALVASIIGKQADRRNFQVWSGTLRGRRSGYAEGLDDLLLSHNKLGDAGFDHILTVLQSDTWIKCIDARGNNLTSQCLSRATDVVSENGYILILDTRDNQNTDISFLLQILAENARNYSQDAPFARKYSGMLDNMASNQVTKVFELKSLADRRPGGRNKTAGGKRPQSAAVKRESHEGCCDECKMMIAQLKKKCALLAKENAKFKKRSESMFYDEETTINIK